MTDDLSERRRGRGRGRRPPRPGALVPPAEPPGWVRTFVIPRNACAACARHYHHRCHGVDVLRDPVPDCPCDCGDPHNPFRLNPRAWADLALHAPDQVWIAAMFERQRAVGLHTCSWRDDGSGLHAARPE